VINIYYAKFTKYQVSYFNVIVNTIINKVIPICYIMQKTKKNKRDR